ncbi:MAG: TOMM precursor leader peptide-binding protein [Isosphaeraceae bacterium]
MLERPRFKPHLRVEVVPGEGVFVLAPDAAQTLLRGRLYELITPHLLGGGLSADEVCDALADRASAAEVFYVLGQLEKKGFLCGDEAKEGVADGESAWWWSRGVDPRVAVRRLAAARVAVDALGVDAQAIRSLLQVMKVRVNEDDRDQDKNDDGCRLLVVATDSYRRPELAAINARALARRQPWLLVRPVGTRLWLGPLFRPGVTGCWECLAHRLRANAPVAAYLESRDGCESHGDGGGDSGAVRSTAPDDAAMLPSSTAAAWGLIAGAVADWIVRGESPGLEGKVQTFDPSAWKTESHTMVRLPFCPACGPTQSREEPRAEDDLEARPIVLQSHRRDPSRDAGSRTVSPEETLRRYEHHVSPITGAVSMLERIGPTAIDRDDTDGVVHVYLAGTNLSRRHRSLAHLKGDLRNNSSGKGTTDAQARASGLCEGLERYSGVHRGDETMRRATSRQLGPDAVPLGECLLFSERQYRERQAWNARKSHYHFVPVPLDPNLAIDWTPAWSMTRREPRYLPTAFCYYNAPLPSPGAEPFCIGDSNGCAAGNTIEEAILQGFLELVERDAVALWWYNRVRRPAVDLESFEEPYLRRVANLLRGRGRGMWVLDLTTDLGIPAFAAFSRELDGAEERIMPGFGAHLDARTALLRAVTEMNQMLANVPERAQDLASGGGGGLEDGETLEWLRTATVANQPYLLPAEGVPARTASSFGREPGDDLADDVRRCQAIVEERGLELIVLDQTRPEIGLPVVKVIVPGLRHFWARFAPGRLYDVPVSLGWLDRPTTESELNPIPMFL